MCSLHHHVCRPSVGRGVAPSPNSFEPWRLGRQAFHGVLQTFYIEINEEIISIDALHARFDSNIQRLLIQILSTQRGVKFQISTRARMHEIFTSRQEIKYFNSGFYTLLNDNSAESLIIACFNEIISQLNMFIYLGSSWSLLGIQRIEVNTAHYVPIRGGDHIQLCAELRRKRGIANVPVTSQCFTYCVYAAYLGLTVRHQIERLDTYDSIISQNRQHQLINLTRIPPEVSIRHVKLFERDNHTFSVNVYGFADKSIFPIHLTTERKQYHLDTLMYFNESARKAHFVFIYDFSLFMGRAGQRRKYYCYYCLSGFNTAALRDAHSNMCKDGEHVSLKFQEPGSYDKVNLYEYSLPRAVLGFIDFECILNDSTTVRNAEKILQPCSFCYCIVDTNSKVLEYGEYVGKDAASKLVKQMDRVAERFLPLTQTFKHDIVYTQEGLLRAQSDNCYICGQIMNESDSRHLHHNHYGMSVRGKDGEVIGPGHVYAYTHPACNTLLRVQKKLSIFAHNFQKFDCIPLLRGFLDNPTENLKCVARNANSFLTISYNKVQYLDSFRHLPFSLSELVKILRKSGLHKFKVTNQVFERYKQHLDNLIQKMHFCYDYISWENLYAHNTTLPHKEVFFNSLTQEHITDDGYNHCSYAYALFGCTTIGQFLSYYNLLDVCLNCDTYMAHRENSLFKFNVEPTNFLSTPAMAYRLSLGWSQQKLDYITDAHIFRLARKALRGGVVNFAKRLAVANYSDRPNFDPSQPESSIIQVDAASLYAFCMLKPLCISGYKLLSRQEFENLDPLRIPDDGPIGYLWCVDLEIDINHHDRYSQYPPIVERVVIDASLASEFQRNCRDENEQDFLKQFKSEQLLGTLYPKKKYTLHGFLLKLFLNLGGIKITHIHEVVQYNQAPFLRGFVDMGVTNRNEEEDENMKAFYKLLLNSAYGFYSVDVTAFKNIKICKSQQEALKLISQPNFKGFSIVENCMAILESSPSSVKVTNHLLLASAILDRSKYHMLNTHYNHILPYFQQKNVKIDHLYTDTDSNCYHIYDNYESVLQHLNNINIEGQPLMDYSYLPSDHSLYNTQYKKVPGTFQSETKYNRILKYCCLRKKCYSLKIEGQDDKIRAKGISKSLAKKHFKYESYEDTLLNGNLRRIPIKFFKRQDQQIYQIAQTKLALTNFTTSRYLLGSRGIESIPFGHYSILEGEGVLLEAENA